MFYNYLIINPGKPGRYDYEGLPFGICFEPLYVGKGKNKRWLFHFKTPVHSNPHLKRTLQKLLNAGFSPEECLVKWPSVSEEHSLEIEKLFIKNIGRQVAGTGPLLNLTEGGEGVSGIKLPHDVRMQISERQKKRTGKANAFFGKIHSEESRIKMRNAALQRWQSGSCRTKEGTEKIRQAVIKRHVLGLSIETKQKISDGLKKAWEKRKCLTP
jgi:NUMOD3 motif